MDDVDSDTLARTSQRYVGLRRRYWRFILSGIAIFVVLGTPLFAIGKRLNSVDLSLLGVPLAVGFLTCWVGGMLTWFALMRFRCPRCGKRFVVSWSGSWPTSDCKPCALRLG